jgi:hypothetical protein
MSFSVSSNNTNRTDLEQIPQPTIERQHIKHGDGNTAAQSEHTASPTPAPSSNPTDGARDATTNHPPTHDEIERLTEECLGNDSDYQAAQKKLDDWKDLENDFAAMDHFTGLFEDRIVTLDNVRALAGDAGANPAARAAAQRLLNNMSIWNELASGRTGTNDGVVGMDDVTAFVAKLKSDVKAIKESTRAAVTAELQPSSAGGSGATAGGGAPAPAAAGTSGATAGAEPLFKAPTLSTKPGMEGAVENIGNTLTAIGNATADVAAQLANPNLSPEDKQKLQARYNDLQQLQSMLTAMYTQIQEAIANLMKMYSDVAKNSIQNMR